MSLKLIHVGLAVLGQSLLGISSLVSLFYLFQENRLKKKIGLYGISLIPSLEILDMVHFRILIFGFCALSLGILTGAFWAYQIWHGSWLWESKQVWTFLGWLIYAALIQGRILTGLRGRRAAWYSLIAFMLLLFNFFGLTLSFSGGHRILP